MPARAGGALALLAVAALGAPAGAQDLPAGDPIAGRKVVRTCAVCHGANGIAKLPEAPNLAGQNPGYLARQLQDFRSGARRNDTMSLLAAGLSDRQIADVAAYYGAIGIQVGKLPGP